MLVVYDPANDTPVLHPVGVTQVPAPVQTALFCTGGPPVRPSLTKLLSGWIRRCVTQAWYESGGVVSQAAILMVTSALITDFNRVAQLDRVFKRRVLGLYASSQIRLNQLWAPPKMLIGNMYAESFRSLALGLVYAPIYPLAFLLTAYSLAQSFYATKVNAATIISECSPRAHAHGAGRSHRDLSLTSGGLVLAVCVCVTVRHLVLVPPASGARRPADETHAQCVHVAAARLGMRRHRHRRNVVRPLGRHTPRAGSAGDDRRAAHMAPLLLSGGTIRTRGLPPNSIYAVGYLRPTPRRESDAPEHFCCPRVFALIVFC